MNSSSIGARLRAALMILCAALGTGGCYLWQSVSGQLTLMSERKPIAAVIADPKTSGALRAQLRSVAAVRDFASRELKLPDNGSYRAYADIGRAYVVWNVVAAAEFSVEPKEWRYPMVGCLTYRGYFSEGEARRYAGALHAGGLDVTVGGVAAYSTLGHFNDPVLSSMMGWDDVELASIIFHELTHQLLYVRDDTSFNEALATAVEEEGVKRWLHAQGRDAELEAHRRRQRRYVEVVGLLGRTRTELRAIYASGDTPARMRERKREAFASLREQYGRLREQWGGRAPLDDWMSADLNNAHLASLATYFSCVPGFERELAAAGGDLEAFYGRVRRLAKMDRTARDALLCGT